MSNTSGDKTNNLKKALFMLLYDGYDMPDIDEDDSDEDFIKYIIYALVERHESTCPFKNYGITECCESSTGHCLSDVADVDCGKEQVEVWESFIGIENK